MSESLCRCTFYLRLKLLATKLHLLSQITKSVFGRLRISEILKAKGLTQKEFARLLNKRESEISKWLTGRHNFTTQTIARIETALGSKLISIAH
ncbi:MAG: helix-turn-helix domain-containing protein [Segatella copri]